MPKVRHWRIIHRMNKALYTIVETRPFIQDAKSRLTDEERVALIDMIAANPNCGDILEGTGGIRKARFAVQGRGKSGGVRVVYYFHNEKSRSSFSQFLPRMRRIILKRQNEMN